MSFMSFDYAMRAADAALQFQQSQGQNIKDTNARAREVGTGNAKRKDDLVRQKIEAEYDVKSADIKKEKAQKLAQLAEEKKKTALLTQMVVGAGTLLGGVLDGVMDLAKGDGSQQPDIAQMSVGADAAKDGYATAFRVAAGTGNSEEGVIAAFNRNKGGFSMVSYNTTTGQPNGFVNVSASQMASNILNATKNDPQHAHLRSMIDQGPPPMFKAECFKDNGDGTFDLQGGLKEALFGGPNGPGFLAEGSRVNGAGQAVGNEGGERMVASMLKNPAPITTAYRASAESLMGLLGTEQIQKGMQINPETVKKTGEHFDQAGITKGFGAGVANVANKLLFKPLGTSINQFMELAKVAKQYDEEYQAKMAEYEQAKRQAALAREKLQKLQSLLAMGSSG